MKIRDSEYTNFLLDQSENLKKIKSSGVKALNESLDENQEEGLKELRICVRCSVHAHNNIPKPDGEGV